MIYNDSTWLHAAERCVLQIIALEGYKNATVELQWRSWSNTDYAQQSEMRSCIIKGPQCGTKWHVHIVYHSFIINMK